MGKPENTTNHLVPLNLSAIWTILRERGYKPKLDGDHIRVNAAVEGCRNMQILIRYKYPRLDMWLPFAHNNMDLSAAQMITDKITNELVMIKANVGTLDNNQDVIVQFYIVSLCRYEAEFRDTLSNYITLFEKAMIMYAEEVSAMEKSAAKIKRPHIYYPEYRGFSFLFENISSGKTTIEALTDEYWIRSTIKEYYSANQASDWDSFRINRVENFGEYKLIVYQFPEPKFVPEARYGVVMLNTTTLAIDYYTMEMSFNGQWAYCSCTTERHNNYGSFDSGELDDFIKWVLEDKKQLVGSTDWNTGEITPAEAGCENLRLADPQSKSSETQDQTNSSETADANEEVTLCDKLREKIKDFGFAVGFIVVLAAFVTLYLTICNLIN